MARHIFSFDGGKELTSMTASWFVSYCYYEHIDREHKNWQTVSTATNRMSVYKRTNNYHTYWLKKVLQMNEYNLNKNTIKLSGTEIKNMAAKLLENL